MDQSLPHIVVAEREFLVALDAEYLVASAVECRVSVIRPEQLDHWDSAQLAAIDLCLLDVPLEASRVTARIERLIAERVPLLFSTVSDIHRDGVTGFEIIPVAMKPYDGETLAGLVRERLRQRPQPLETDQN